MIFLLVSFAVLFGLFLVILSIRYLINRRLTAYEKRRLMEEQARKTAESNSGL